MVSDEQWQRADRPWRNYPLGTKARCSWEGSYWIKTGTEWKSHDGGTFSTPGAADEVLLPTDYRTKENT